MQIPRLRIIISYAKHGKMYFKLFTKHLYVGKQ